MILSTLVTTTCRLLRPVVEHRPVEDEVVLNLFPAEEILHQPPQVRVVRPVLKPQAPAVSEVGHELLREGLAERLDWRAHFLLHDFFVLLLLADCLQSLPWQRPPVEVHENVADGLQIVAAGLFDTQVRVDRGISRGTG